MPKYYSRHKLKRPAGRILRAASSRDAGKAGKVAQSDARDRRRAATGILLARVRYDPRPIASLSAPLALTVPAVGTLTEYIYAAMSLAVYELIEDEGGYFGTIPTLKGLWGQGATREACREDLQAALEDWILLGLVNRQPVPVINGIEVRADRIA